MRKQTAAVEYFDSVNKLATENQSNTPTRLTAVEWLAEQLKTKYDINIERLSVTDKAKAMEKDQIIDAANWDSRSISENGIRKGDKYYNETFGE